MTLLGGVQKNILFFHYYLEIYAVKNLRFFPHIPILMSDQILQLKFLNFCFIFLCPSLVYMGQFFSTFGET
jgi:hypothetical protein